MCVCAVLCQATEARLRGEIALAEANQREAEAKFSRDAQAAHSSLQQREEHLQAELETQQQITRARIRTVQQQAALVETQAQQELAEEKQARLRTLEVRPSSCPSVRSYVRSRARTELSCLGLSLIHI